MTDETRAKILDLLTRIRDSDAPIGLRSTVSQMLMRTGDESEKTLEVAYGDPDE